LAEELKRKTYVEAIQNVNDRFKVDIKWKKKNDYKRIGNVNVINSNNKNN